MALFFLRFLMVTFSFQLFNPNLEAGSTSIMEELAKLLGDTSKSSQINLNVSIFVVHSFLYVKKIGFIIRLIRNIVLDKPKFRKRFKLKFLDKGHSSQYHLGLSMKVLGFCSNFHHLLSSMRKVNSENCSSIASTKLILGQYEVWQAFRKFSKLMFWLILEA